MSGRTVLVQGAANKKSVAFRVGKSLEAAGAHVIWAVHTEARRDELAERLGTAPVLVVDAAKQDEIDACAATLGNDHPPLDGYVHSIAFADYSDGLRPFHETRREHFLEAVNVSAFSLIAMSNALAPRFREGASVVTISISTTSMASENYGYMAPVKAALDSSVVFLAKSFSPSVRFNSVRAGLLKTSSSAGIPGYLESYLFAEAATLRGKGPTTDEVADTALFLLSPRSTGINAKGLVVDAGMDVNYFDAEIVRKVSAPDR
ncbi:MAG: SDR family oxidoreductase [Planctomycetota bacterium]